MSHAGHDTWALLSRPGRAWCRTCQVEFAAPIPEEEGPPESEPWTVTGSQRSDPGSSIIILNVEDPYGVAHVIGVDARQAYPILDAFYAGDVVLIEAPEPWQILSTFDAHPDEPALSDQPDPDREED